MRSKLSAASAVVLVSGLVSAGVVTTAYQAAAAPAVSATDNTKVPHYFGPNANWANSPLTKPNATVTIAPPAAGGVQAVAVANVDPLTGGVSTIDIVNPGKGYTAAPSVSIGGGDGTATATASITTTGSVTGYAITKAPDGTPRAGGGYDSFHVEVTDGGGTGATARASGGVDVVHISNGGAGYTMPTVEFALPDEPNGVQAKGHVPMTANGDPTNGMDANGTITDVVIDNPGSGYTKAPEIAVHNGTLFDPISGADPVVATTTLKLTGVTPVEFGSGYATVPTVTVTEGTPGASGAGAEVTASINSGSVTDIAVGTHGTGYLDTGIKKFQDTLPGTCDPASPAGCPAYDPNKTFAEQAKYIPLAVPQTTTRSGVQADEYVIGLVQYRTRFSSDLPPTLVRGYVQLETPANAAISQHVPLTNELLDGSKVQVKDAAGNQYLAVTPPQWLGPFIAATKDRPVRITFRNLLPTGADGDLFLPTDSSMMGAGMGPMAMAPDNQGTVTDGVRNPSCTQEPKGSMCFKDNRATLHLHGGITPWISDGTPHQWITPAGESTDWPQGVSVRNVPDMADVGCDAATDGCQTFYYTNQQSARLMFYHDHAWGITRLNVYAGEAAGYQISDATEKKLVDGGLIPGAADTIPLVVQDRTFTPDDKQLYDVDETGAVLKTPADYAAMKARAGGHIVSYGQDPTWDAKRWGTKGSFWYHHVYMTAQNPGDPSGMSAYGRWMYGPWFWPPAAGTKYMPIDNPYYDASCNLDDPATWQYQTDPYCEPKQIPGTPNISAGMEQFNDTPIVNGVAYPKVTLQPKAYRLRMLNAANDRFFNFQWYTADSDPNNNGANLTEVKLKQAELDAAQNDPNIVPTPEGANNDAYGPDWVQIASEGGFLPAPAVIDGQQPTTWITDPTRFDVGNVDKHSLLLAPAERADVIVDFSRFAGKTLILYNDAPAAFPARVPQYDYYTGAPDLSPAGAPKILPGYGPNTRTIMRVTIADTTPAAAYNLTGLQNAFKHNLQGTGVFESGQHPIVVGQAAYNSAYGTNFAASGNCSVGTSNRCDGLVRINDTASFNFNTLRSQSTRVNMPLQPKAIHDEMNSSTFDEFGRMQANLGVEASPPTPGAQNVTLYPYVNPQTELIDGTKLPTGDVKVTPISDLADGTQLWRITHNGVDTHPIHFHLFDVQVLNRVTWDNIIIANDPNENGWKDTVRISPLEDTIVAVRPVTPKLPFEIPNSIRELNPMMPDGSPDMFNNVDVQGNPTTAITNKLVNFGWEYVYHCHILSHEEMDMMRPVSYVLPPTKANGLARTVDAAGKITISWVDNSISETGYLVQRSANGTTWVDVGTSDSPLDQPNTKGSVRSVVDGVAGAAAADQYRVVARNTVGYGGQFPSMTAQSISDVYTETLPAAPSNLVATQGAGTTVNLSFLDNASNEAGYVVERSTDGTTFSQIGTVAATAAGTAGTTLTYADATATRGPTYTYRVGAQAAGSATIVYSNLATISLVAAPSNLVATALSPTTAQLAWTDNAANETAFVVQRSINDGATWTDVITTLPPAAGQGTTVTFSDTTVPVGQSVSYRVGAVNGADVAYSNVATISLVTAPTGLTAAPAAPQAGAAAVALAWADNATNETGYVVERMAAGGAWAQVGAALPVNSAAVIDATVVRGTTYSYRVAAVNAAGRAYSNVATITVTAAPSNLAVTVSGGPRATLTWTDNSTNETSFVVERRVGAGAWAPVGTVAANAVTYADTTVVAGTTYGYRVGAVNGPDTAYSSEVTVTIIAAPTNLAATIVTGPNGIRLTWTDRATNETGYVVQRSTDGGTSWSTVATRGAVGGTGNTANWTDTAVTLGTTYTYRLQVLNATASAYSNQVSVLFAVPATPANVAGTATAAGANSETLRVTWTDLPNETGYTVQWSTNGTTVSGSQNLAANTVTYSRNTSRRVWYVRVRATNQLGNGAWSAWVAVPSA
ncbi:MAG: multicopper oxidase domain-containing protein [Kineosporiaceae bacterium]